MKKNIKRIGIILGLLAAIILVPPLFMPSTYMAESTIIVKTDPYNAFQYFADLKKWELWSPWKEKDPAIQYSYSENTYGAGAFMSWQSSQKELGVNKITTVQFKKFGYINYELMMKEPYKSKSNGEFKVEKMNDTECKITWNNKGRLQYPFGRWFNAFAGIQKMLEKDFSRGLTNFKKVVESTPAIKLPALNPVTMEMDDLIIFSVMHETLRNSEISSKIAEDYQTITKTIERSGAIIKPNEPPLCLFYHHNRISTRMRPGIAVQGCVPMQGDVECISLRKGRTLRFTYLGSYQDMELTYDAIDIYLEENKIKKRENYTWEQYITDPMLEPDSTQWLTYIYVPIK